MKLLPLFFFLVLTHFALGQSGSSLEFTTSGNFSRISYFEKYEHQVTYENGIQETIYGDSYNGKKYTIGVGFQLGYFISEKWSLGAQSSIATSVESWDLIFPNKMGLYTSGGIYGKFHMNDELSLMSSVNVIKNYNYSPNIGFGFGPEITKVDGSMSFRLLVEYGVGGQRENANMTDGYNSKGFYAIDEAKFFNRSLMIQIGSVFYPFRK